MQSKNVETSKSFFITEKHNKCMHPLSPLWFVFCNLDIGWYTSLSIDILISAPNWLIYAFLYHFHFELN